MARPGTRKAVCRARACSSSRRLGVLEEDLPVGPVADRGSRSSSSGDLADDSQPVTSAERRVGPCAVEDAGVAAAEGHRVDLAAAVHLDVEPRGEGVDHRGADAVQAAGGGVGAAAELAAGVQLGHHDLDAGEPGLGLDVDRDAAAVVADLDRAVGVQHDLDAVAVAGRAPRRPSCR